MEAVGVILGCSYFLFFFQVLFILVFLGILLSVIMLDQR